MDPAGIRVDPAPTGPDPDITAQKGALSSLMPYCTDERAMVFGVMSTLPAWISTRWLKQRQGRVNGPPAQVRYTDLEPLGYPPEEQKRLFQTLGPRPRVLPAPACRRRPEKSPRGSWKRALGSRASI
jgi:hypothetical protein